MIGSNSQHKKVLFLCICLLFITRFGKAVDDVNWSELETCGDGRKCVTYNLCPELYSRTGIAEMISKIPVSDRFGDDFSGCHDNLEVCCPEPFKIHSICSNVTARARECGSRNEKGLNFNHNKLIAGYAEFPWVVAIFEDAWVLHKTHKFFRNTGSLVHPNVAITSAVEIADIFAEKLVVRAGEWNLQSVSEMCKHEERGVAKVIKHSDYRDNRFQNNLALIVLDKEFQLSPTINIVCLPPKTSNFDYHNCLLSGWDKEGSIRTDKAILKKSNSKVIPRNICEEKLRDTMLGVQFELHRNFLCAEGEPGVDVSKFSGGSPLLCPTYSQPNHLFLAGITVGGFSCVFQDIPEIYADLSKQRDWIEEEFLANGIGYSFDNS